MQSRNYLLDLWNKCKSPFSTRHLGTASSNLERLAVWVIAVQNMWQWQTLFWCGFFRKSSGFHTNAFLSPTRRCQEYQECALPENYSCSPVIYTECSSTLQFRALQICRSVVLIDLNQHTHWHSISPPPPVIPIFQCVGQHFGWICLCVFCSISCLPL